MPTPTPRPPVAKPVAKQVPKALPNPVISQDDYLLLIHEIAGWQKEGTPPVESVLRKTVMSKRV